MSFFCNRRLVEFAHNFAASVGNLVVCCVRKSIDEPETDPNSVSTDTKENMVIAKLALKTPTMPNIESEAEETHKTLPRSQSSLPAMHTLAEKWSVVPCLNWNEHRCGEWRSGVRCPFVPDHSVEKYHVCRHCLKPHTQDVCGHIDDDDLFGQDNNEDYGAMGRLKSNHVLGRRRASWVRRRLCFDN